MTFFNLKSLGITKERVGGAKFSALCSALQTRSGGECVFFPFTGV